MAKSPKPRRYSIAGWPALPRLQSQRRTTSLPRTSPSRRLSTPSPSPRPIIRQPSSALSSRSTLSPSARRQRPRLARPLQAEANMTLPTIPVPETPRPSIQRPPRMGIDFTPPTRDSYPGPFRRLDEYSTRPGLDSPGIQLQRELDATLLESVVPTIEKDLDDTERDRDRDSTAGVDGTDGKTPTPTGDRFVRYSSTTRSDLSPRPSSTVSQTSLVDEEFPDAGFDLDVNISDGVTFDVNVEGDINAMNTQYEALRSCNVDRERLEEAIHHLEEDLRLLRDEHEQQMETAQIEIEQGIEELKHREDQIFDLQQQLDDAKAGLGASINGDDESLIEMDDDGNVASLTEQLAKQKEIVADLTDRITSNKGRINMLQTRLRKRSSAETTDTDQDPGSSRKQLERCKEYIKERDAAMKVKEDRLDDLWDVLRNLKDLDATAQEQNDLRARMAVLNATLRRTIESIEEPAASEHQHIAETSELSGTIESLNAELAAAKRRIAIFERLRQKTHGDVADEDSEPDVDCEEEIANYRDQVARLTDKINSLNRELDAARLSNSRLEQRIGEGGDRDGGSAPSAEQEEMDDFIQKMWTRLAKGRNENKKLRHELKLAEEKYAKGAGIQGVDDFHFPHSNWSLKETIKDLEHMNKSLNEEVSALREHKEKMRQEIERLQEEGTEVDGYLHEAGFVKGYENPDELLETSSLVDDHENPDDLLRDSDEGTPLELEELPQVKRVRRSRRDGDEDYQDGGEEALDLISPSSFIESEPSPLLHRLRRASKTRSDTESLSPEVESEPESDEPEDEEARFRRDLAAVAPADPRAGVVVIDRGEAARAKKSAGTPSKRKRQTR